MHKHIFLRFIKMNLCMPGPGKNTIASILLCIKSSVNLGGNIFGGQIVLISRDGRCKRCKLVLIGHLP
jgi:hypothetical protein